MEGKYYFIGSHPVLPDRCLYIVEYDGCEGICSVNVNTMEVAEVYGPSEIIKLSKLKGQKVVDIEESFQDNLCPI